MGEIRIVGLGKRLGYPYLVCKNKRVNYIVFHFRYMSKIMIGSACDICKKNLFRAKVCKYCR